MLPKHESFFPFKFPALYCCYCSHRWYLGNTSHSDADNLLKQESNTTGKYILDLVWNATFKPLYKIMCTLRC